MIKIILEWFGYCIDCKSWIRTEMVVPHCSGGVCKCYRSNTMSKNWNNFCLYCTGNKVKDIRECDDRNCPFYPFRRGGLEKEVEVNICKKILKETGVVQ